MYKKTGLHKYFTKKMIWLSIITGLLITLSMPLTFLYLSYKEVKNYAYIKSIRIEEKISEHISNDPRLWQYNIQKFLQIFSDSDMEGIASIYVYDNNNNMVFAKINDENNWFSLKVTNEIKYNNQVFGYIVLEEKTKRLASDLISISLIFLFIGVLTSYVLYRFPSEIIFKAEKEIEKSLKKLYRLSYFDSLTNLRNRSYFYEMLRQWVSIEKKFSVMYLDLDRFKLINDTYGHSIGDSLLQQVAQRLQGVIHPDNVIARLGGDEFAILIRNVQEEGTLLSIAQTIIEQFQRPFTFNQRETWITLSIGIAIYPLHGRTLETIIKNADIAMYYSKNLSENTVSIYQTSMKRQIEKNLIL